MWLIFVFFHIEGDSLLTQTTLFFQGVFWTEQDINDETLRSQLLTIMTRLLSGTFQGDEMDVNNKDIIYASGSASLL